MAKQPGSKKKRLSNGTSTSAETIAFRERAAKALELRKEGRSFEEIAKEAGFASRQRAFDAVKEAIKRITREPAEEVLVLELERLDAMWQVHYLNAQAGDVQALSGCLRIMERRATLLGIDAPKKVDAKVETTAPIVNLTLTSKGGAGG